MHRYKTAWYSIRPTHDFQAVKVGGSKGGPGPSWGGSGCHGASWGGSGVPGVGGKEDEPKASVAERAGNIDHTAITVNHSKARRTIQVVDTGLEFCEYPLLEKLHFHIAFQLLV